MNDELAKIRELAQERLDALQEPPWATRRYQHLVTLLNEMLATQAAAIPPDNVVPIASARRRTARMA
jgi:hypothetical protein